jgi:hypothetical protein
MAATLAKRTPAAAATPKKRRRAVLRGSSESFK